MDQSGAGKIDSFLHSNQIKVEWIKQMGPYINDRKGTV